MSMTLPLNRLIRCPSIYFPPGLKPLAWRIGAARLKPYPFKTAFVRRTLALARRADHRLHLFQVVFQRALTGGSQLERGARLAADKRLRALYVARIFQLAGMDAEVSVGDLQ